MNLCPACTNALNPSCPEPACRREWLRAETAQDLNIEASES